MSDLSPERVDELAEVIADWTDPQRPDIRNGLYEALAPLAARWIAEAQAEALREAASDIVADCSNQPGPCICTARHWLRDRATRITAEGQR